MEVKYGYKLMNHDMTAIGGFQYDLNREYALATPIQPDNGFYFCSNPLQCFSYYDNLFGDLRMFVVEGTGPFIEDEDKIACSKIKLIEEIIDVKHFITEIIDLELEKGHESLLFEGDSSTYYWLVKHQELSTNTLQKILNTITNNKQFWPKKSHIKATIKIIEEILQERDKYDI